MKLLAPITDMTDDQLKVAEHEALSRIAYCFYQFERGERVEYYRIEGKTHYELLSKIRAEMVSRLNWEYIAKHPEMAMRSTWPRITVESLKENFKK